MDFEWVILGAGALTGGLIGGFIGGSAVGYFKDWALSARVDGLEARFHRMHNQSISGDGTAVKNQKAERMSQAVAEAAALMQSGKKPEEALKEIAAKYPDVALDVIQKTMRGKGGLAGLLGGLGG